MTSFSFPLTALIPLLIVLLVLFLLLRGYVKAPPDKAFIISGLRKKPKILVGRAGVKLPLLERLDVLYLGQMTVDIKTEQSVPTTDFINVNVDAVAKVRIAPDGAGIEKASRNFLNKKPEQIALDLQDSLQGNMREIIGTLTLKDINTNRDSFSDQVMMKAATDMDKLGIEILSCNIQNVTDEKGLINDLGADNTSKIKKDAAIAKAQADRDVAIAQAEANKAANDARVLADTEIAQKNNELAIRQSELKVISDTKKAEADAAYEIQKQAQQKNIQIATVNAQIAKAERDSELKKQEVGVMQQALDAEINKKADAEKYRVEQEAAAGLAKRQREAEAKKYEQEKEAEAKKAVADAAKYSAEQEAAGIRAKYEAEAAGIALKGKAEAEAKKAVGLAEAEAMEKKAEAYQKYNNAAMAEMLIKVLPDIAEEIAKPLAQIDKITIIGGEGRDGGVSQMASNVPAVMAKLFESMKETTGIDLGEIMKAGSYDAKVNRNIHVTGLENVISGPEKREKSEEKKEEKAEQPDTE
ncbi:SPFH/Band 7/PHB domain protein [Oribacterium sp. oral taxon 078 str. F0262]|uniref:flotillin family protein n=1 Tax=Oribacterium sp. oral taxon 078 TaxID=652706 RepID=UPI0001BCBF95|nr:flotillin family protein [Oribacterium sp. oral taxon 078]EFE91298.1 SPFH/Band 7/PHB domain protein [Oribacterium sp. oral taxon 078 str. F0262]